MKLIILCLLITANLVFASFKSLDSTEFRINDKSINSAIKESIEGIKKQMPCGFEEFGIPILAPYKKEYINLDYKQRFFSILLQLMNIRVDGLNKFDTNEASFSVLKLKLDFEFNFKSIDTIGQYLMRSLFVNKIEFSGDGDIDFKLKNLNIKGSIQFKVSKGGVVVKDLQVKVTLGGVKSNISGLIDNGIAGYFANRVIEKFLLNFIKEEDILISNTIQDFVTPIIDDYLSTMTLAELIKLITTPRPPVECIPPEDSFDNFQVFV